MDAGNFFAGSSSSDDSTTHHHHHHILDVRKGEWLQKDNFDIHKDSDYLALGMLISFTVLACGIMLEDCCGPIAGTILLMLVGLMDGLSITIGNETAKNLEEMTPTASGSHRAADQGKKTPFISLLSPFLERLDVEDTSAKGHEKQSNPALESKKKSENIELRKGLEKPTNLVVESKRKSESIDSRKGLGKRLSPVFECKRKSKNIDSSITMKPIGNGNAKNLKEMTPTASGSHKAADQGKKTPFISLLSPFLERIDVENTSAKGHEKQSNPVFECIRKGLEKPSNLVVESKRKLESIGSRKGLGKRLSPVFECIRKSKNIDSGKGLQKRSNPVLESKRKSEHTDSRKGPQQRLWPVVESKRKSENIGSRKGHVKQSNLVVESKKKSENIDPRKQHEKRSNLVVESKKKSENIDLRCKQDKKVVGTHRTSPCFAPARGDASVVVRSGFVRSTLIRDGKSIGYENWQGKDKQLNSVLESRRKSEKVVLSRKQDKNVVNMHRMIPHVVSASLSEFVQPTSILKGGKPIESQKQKGHEKLLSSVVESRRKSEHIGLVRKQDKQVIGTQRTIPNVPAQGHMPVVRSGLVRPTLIQKDSKLIGSEKLQGREKLLISAVESKRKSGIIDSRRQNDNNIVGTLKDLVDERSPQSVSKHKNVKTVPQVPPYKGRTFNSTSDLKARWKF